MYCRPATTLPPPVRPELPASHRQTGICQLCIEVTVPLPMVATPAPVIVMSPLGDWLIRPTRYTSEVAAGLRWWSVWCPAACSPMLLPKAPVTSPAKVVELYQPLCYSSARLVRYRWYLPDTGQWYRRRYWQSWCRREVYTVGG